MAHSKKTRGEAEYQFVRRGRTLQAIADDLDVSKGTLARWSTGGGWAAKRTEYLTESPDAPLRKLKNMRRRLIEEMPTDADPAAIDGLYKLDKMIEGMEAKRNAVGPALDVMESFAVFAAGHFDADTVNVIRAAAEKFLDHLRDEAQG